MLIRDRWRRQIYDRGLSVDGGVHTSFKTGSSRKTGGTRKGGCRSIDPLPCAKIGV